MKYLTTYKIFENKDNSFYYKLNIKKTNIILALKKIKEIGDMVDKFYININNYKKYNINVDEIFLFYDGYDGTWGMGDVSNYDVDNVYKGEYRGEIKVTELEKNIDKYNL